MALAAGPISYQRFFITGGQAPKDVTDKFVAAIQERAFGRLAPFSDDSQVGWIGPGHLFETEIAPERIAFGRFVHLALRVDRLKPPANILKAYTRMAEAAALRASGREYLSKTERRKAREAALARADQERKAGDFRRMNAYPVLIDLEGRAVYLAGTSAALADTLMALARDTFGWTLEPADPETLATRLLVGAKKARPLETLEAFRLVRGPARSEDDSGDVGDDLRFLGKEFLTWLWYQVEADREALRLHGRDEVSVAIDKSLRLRCDFGVSGTTVITADGPTGLPEAHAALRSGKQPRRMGLVIGGAAGNFTLTLDGERFTVTGLIVAEYEQAADARARIEARFERLTEAAGVLDGLYELFLLRRCAADFGRELRSMSAWAAGGARAAAATA